MGEATMAPILGSIADDFTGATDLANMLVRGGLRTVLWFDITRPIPVGNDTDAVVVALKTRSISAADACDQSVAALRALQKLGIERFLFKYCSTFDSTDQGNIGPVAAALCNALNTDRTVFCPAYPETGRTVYQGHLFVNRRLLHESGMQDHPLNPMRSSDLTELLRRQSTRTVGLLPYHVVSAGRDAIQKHLDVLRADQVQFIICDSLDDQHLGDLAQAVVDWPLVTGGAGIGYWLARSYRRIKLLRDEPSTPSLPQVTGKAAVLAGSCSEATRRQVEHFRKQRPALELDVAAIARGGSVVDSALQWAETYAEAEPILIYSTPVNESTYRVADVDCNGAHDLGAAIERQFADIASGLLKLGIRRLIVAGGETSGALVQALRIRGLRIGPQIDPGVPWTETIDMPRLALALKSGNFGSDDFLTRAFAMLP